MGKIVELGTTGELYRNSRHPWTRALLSAMPDTWLLVISAEAVLHAELGVKRAEPGDFSRRYDWPQSLRTIFAGAGPQAVE